MHKTDEKVNYPPCKYGKKKIHLENFCWWRPDAICEKCKQISHVTKVCKFKNNPQALIVETEIEEHFFRLLHRRSVKICFQLLLK